MPSVKAIERGTGQTESLSEMIGRCGVVDSANLFLDIPEVGWNAPPERVIVPYGKVEKRIPDVPE